MNTNLPVPTGIVAEYNALRTEYRGLMHQLNTSTSACSNILIGIEDYEPNGVTRIASLVSAQTFIDERQAIINRLNEVITRLDYLILIEAADKKAAEFNLAYWDAIQASQRVAQ